MWKVYCVAYLLGSERSKAPAPTAGSFEEGSMVMRYGYTAERRSSAVSCRVRTIERFSFGVVVYLFISI